MGKRAKKELIVTVQPRYLKATKQEKKVILDEFCKVYGCHRKHAIRLLGRTSTKPATLKAGRKPKYISNELLEALKRIWIDSDLMCSKKLKVTLPLWIPYYPETYGPLTDSTRHQLLDISSATIDRILKPTRSSFPRGFCGTKPGSLLRNQIPIRTNHWDVTKPGFVEADTLAHCGNTMEGDFIWSLTLTDINTAWTESRAVWNKGAEEVVAQIKDIEQSLPFKLLGFDCDNGGEFLNHHLIRHFAAKNYAVTFTRSRPNHKNDNPHVEQKNWHHIRHLFGYDRFDDPRLVPLMNDLYAHEWSLLQNHFVPTFKLLSKERLNSKYRKRYEKPAKTPYQRIMESPHVDRVTKNALRNLHATLNPFALKASIQKKLKTIFEYVSVTSNVRQRI